MGGNPIVFVSNRDGNSEIYRMNADGSAQNRLTNHPSDDSRPSQPQDGSRIVWESNRDGNTEIYVMNRDGSGVQRLTNDSGDSAPRDTAPAFSPDGRTIVWVSSRGGNENLWLMDANGANQRQITNFSGVGVRDPEWAPDNRRIAYGYDTDPDLGGGGTLQIIDVNTRGITALSTTTALSNSIRSPSFNAAGNKIVYTVIFRRTVGIFIVDLASGAVTNGPSGGSGFPNNPSWSKTSDVIAFAASITTSSTDSGVQIFVSPSTSGDGSQSRQLTTQGQNSDPSF